MFSRAGSRAKVYLSAVIALAVMAIGLSQSIATICPFCSAVDRTFSEQIDSSDVVIIASLIETIPPADEFSLPKGKFKTTQVIKGHDAYEEGTEFTAVLVGKNELKDNFMLMGTGTVDISWTTPLKASDRLVTYLNKLDSLPAKGGDRLEFFADYFEDQESAMAYDAYDEFARAPYEEVKELKTRLDQDKLIGWIKDPNVMKSRKKLYFTLLGVCGNKEHIPFLEELIRSGDKEKQAGLDALIACYLTLQGDEGVALIEELFLGNPDAEYIDTFSAIAALRFHGTEADKVSTKRIVQALRHVLDRPKMADMVIADLARWEDWSVMERLVDMFKEANTDETSWVRTPIISYLQVCPRPEAKDHIVELRKIDPEAVHRAEMLADLGDWEDEDWDDEDWDDEEETTDDTSTEAGSTDEGKGDTGSGDEKNSASTGVEEDNVVTLTATSQTNSSDGVFVSTESAEPNAGGQAPTQLAQSVQTAAPVASSSPGFVSIAAIVLIPVLVCGILFVLLWSVLNGWFERLIF